MGRKKIIVLSSNGGHGHNAAVATLKTVLGTNYDITTVYPIEQLRIWGVKSGEQIYNIMLQRGFVRTINVVTKHLAPRIFHTRKKKIEQQISRHIELEKPDLVLSLIPFINFPAAEAARKTGVPFLLVTTDNDLRNWVHGLHKVTHPNFKVTIGCDLPSTRGLLSKHRLSDTMVETTGLPLRPDFRAPKLLDPLYQEYGLSADKPVVLIMMGGAGSQGALNYAKAIGSQNMGVQLIVCAGKNEKLIRKLKEIPLHPSNSLIGIGFTDKIADLMALADLIITKPGPGTINEALSMHVPMLIDATTTALSWEKANIELVLQYGVGDCIEKASDLVPKVRKHLHDWSTRKTLEKAFAAVPPNLFHEKIDALVASMITS